MVELKLSCIPMIYFRNLVLEKTMILPEWFGIARTLGLTATEIQHNCLQSLKPADVEHVAGELHKAGLQVCQLTFSSDFSHPDRDFRSAELDYLKAGINAAEILGASSIRLVAGQEREGVSVEQAVEWTVESFRRAIDYAESRGVWLAYENHYKDYFWERPDFSRRSDVFLSILERLVDTPLKVNFDCSNQVMMGEDPVALLQKVKERVVHVHASDRKHAGTYAHEVVGNGSVPFVEVFSILMQSGFAGWVSVEYNGTDGLDGLRESLVNVRELWATATRLAQEVRR